jgi:hypothetical protein
MTDIDTDHYQRRADRAREDLHDVFLDLFEMVYSSVNHGLKPSNRLMDKIRDALMGEL